MFTVHSFTEEVREGRPNELKGSANSVLQRCIKMAKSCIRGRWKGVRLALNKVSKKFLTPRICEVLYTLQHFKEAFVLRK